MPSEETYYLEFNRLITADDLAIATAHGLVVNETYERSFFATGIADVTFLVYTGLKHFDILPPLEPAPVSIKTVPMVYDGPYHY